MQCSGNTPQRCVGGHWEDVEQCSDAAPVCDRGKCVPPSCVGLTDDCGQDRDPDPSCCASVKVTGLLRNQTYNRGNDPSYPATVSDFWLDRFEVTVGRIRRFVEEYPESLEEYPGSRPAAGAGSHPKIAGSGWNPAWDIEQADMPAKLPATRAELKRFITCQTTNQPWTEVRGDHERLPINCLSWYVAFAFCAWDGGRLPTEAEWNYAAAGGQAQRYYPWSNPEDSTTINNEYAVYDCMSDGIEPRSCALSDIQNVGSRRKGDGYWGHADMAGSMWEWTLDWHEATYPTPCVDCSNVELESASEKVFRGGGWNSNAASLLSSTRNVFRPSVVSNVVGVRCARDKPPTESSP
ncbi:SUMF1/EgtB/PvdO family nonheme iron enzyme [Sorangium sp. So ce136]|uniref:formylglycine-generating enzyme family protein n=1 Tax=Sorangium sp. So ce136 TaxID=3133284 RepID=UPI003EFE1363